MRLVELLRESDKLNYIRIWKCTDDIDDMLILPLDTYYYHLRFNYEILNKYRDSEIYKFSVEKRQFNTVSVASLEVYLK